MINQQEIASGFITAKYDSEFQGKEYKDILKQLARIAARIMDAKMVLVLYGTDISLKEFVPSEYWDRAMPFYAFYKGMFGRIKAYAKIKFSQMMHIVPIMHYQVSSHGEISENPGVTSFVMRNCDDFYQKGIYVALIPEMKNITKQKDDYANVPVYLYNGTHIYRHESDMQVSIKVVKLAKAKNFISLYIPNYGVLELGDINEELFLPKSETELKHKLDELVALVRFAALAYYRSGSERLDEESKRIELFSKEKKLTELAAVLEEKKKEVEKACTQNVKLQQAIDDYYIKVLKMHNLSMGSHSESVIAMTLSVLKNMQFNHFQLLEPLINKHDIGKKLIPPELLSKETELSNEEYEIIRAHPWLGALLLQDFPGASEIDSGHHERYDGKGYPNRLLLFYPQHTEFSVEGKNIRIDLSIPLSIVGLLDAMEAMGGTKRAYRKRASIEAILLEVVKYTFIQFHPSAVLSVLNTIAYGGIKIGCDKKRRGTDNYWYFEVEQPELLGFKIDQLSRAIRTLHQTPEVISTLEEIFLADKNNEVLNLLVAKYQHNAWERSKLLLNKYQINLTDQELFEIDKEDKRLLAQLVKLKKPIEKASWYNPKNLLTLTSAYFEEWVFPSMKINNEANRKDTIFQGAQIFLENLKELKAEINQKKESHLQGEI